MRDAFLAVAVEGPCWRSGDEWVAAMACSSMRDGDPFV